MPCTAKTDDDHPQFSVCQFFENGTYEYVRRYVMLEEAIRAFKTYTTNVAAQVGIVKRVILTDGGDCINLEWEYGKGITFPSPHFFRQQ